MHSPISRMKVSKGKARRFYRAVARSADLSAKCWYMYVPYMVKTDALGGHSSVGCRKLGDKKFSRVGREFSFCGRSCGKDGRCGFPACVEISICIISLS